MQTIFFSIPSGSHKRAYFQPLYPLLRQNKDLKIIAITPAAKYPKLLAEFISGKNLQFVEFSNNLFAKYNPDLVTASTTGLDDKDIPILKVAQNMHIKTLVYIESWDNVWKMVKHKKNMVKVNKLLVWNQSMKNQLIKEFNYKKYNIEIVGSPRLDPLALNQELPSKIDLFNELGLDPNRPLIHLATVELYDISYIAKIISQAHAKGKIPKQSQIYASVHPGGDIARHKWYAQKYNLDKLAHSFGRHQSPLKEFAYNPTKSEMLKLYALFKYADVLINLSSTVALESMLANTPVINIKFGKPFDLSWYKSPVYTDFKEHYQEITKHKGTWVVKSKRELIKAVNTYLKNPSWHKEERRQTVKHIITFLDGRCSQRVYNELLKILES